METRRVTCVNFITTQVSELERKDRLEICRKEIVVQDLMKKRVGINNMRLDLIYKKVGRPIEWKKHGERLEPPMMPSMTSKVKSLVTSKGVMHSDAGHRSE